MRHVLIDWGATHSFISYDFVAYVGMTLIILDFHIKICTLIGKSLWPM